MMETIKKRRQMLAGSMADHSLAIILSGDAPVTSGDQFYDYTPHRNFYYLTGIDRSNMALVIRKLAGKVEEYLFIEDVTPLEEKWSGARMRKEEAQALSGVENIWPDRDLEPKLGAWLLNEGFEHAYFDLSRGSFNHANTPQVDIAQKLQGMYPFLQVKNLYHLVTKSRLVKDEIEIKAMRTAIEKTRIGIESLMASAEAGMKEYQLEAYYDFAIKQEGVKKTSFQTIAASGANATVLHYHANNQPLVDGDLILFDLGCEWDYYCSDISRTFPVNGKFSERQKAVYEAVLDVQMRCIEKIKPGLDVADLNKFAKDELAKKCQELGLIEKPEDVTNYYYHSIGHYLGLDTHDVGGRGGILQPGMVITIEPGLYIEEEAIGIRIEDDILVTETGHENLSASILKTVDEIETFMKNSRGAN
ncbi:MAG: aminopeptidase P family protein [Turicibacter sp.]|nr:aminopeptidase P family protein [Turicibacter sp.]